MIRKLFSFGNKSEKKQSKILPENLAAIFGASEGESMEVEVTEAGLTAIEAAETSLISISNQQQQAIETGKTRTMQVEELEKDLATANETIKQQETQIEELGKRPSGNLTAPASSDTVSDEETDKPVSEHKKKEMAELDKAKKAVEKQKSN